jgi:glycosyltransferase involved in cell wall biosynthesis
MCFSLFERRVRLDAMTPVRILMLTTFYPPYSFGGDGISVQRMVRALAARGAEITVVHDKDAYLMLAGSEPNAAPEAVPPNVRVIGLKSQLGSLATLVTQQSGRSLIHGKTLRALVEEFRPDVIWHNNVSLMGAPGVLELPSSIRVYEAHEHWLVCPTHVLWRHGRELCTERQCLRCVIAHRRPPQLWRYTNFLDRQLDKMDLIIAKSEFSRDKHRDFGLKHDMHVLPLFLPPKNSAPDVSRASDAEPVHTRPFFLFVGRLERIKGVQDIIPIFRGQDRADLIIAGDGDFAPDLRKQTQGDPRIRFVGRIPPEDLARYYAGALASIVPSLCFETFGAVLIESFREGTPVIARNLGPFPEIMNSAGAGCLFETGEDLLTAMTRILDEPDLRRTWSEAALAAFDGHWQTDQVLKQYGNAFSAAAQKKSLHDLGKRLRATFGCADHDMA